MSEQSKLDFSIFRRLTRFVKPYKRLLILSFACMLVLSVLTPARPMLIGEMVSRYIIGGQDSSALLNWTLVILGMLLLEAIFQFLGTFVTNLLAQSVIRDMRHRLFKHLIAFRMRYFDKTPIGALVTRVVSDIEAISEVFSAGLVDIVGDLILLIVVIVLMTISNWQLTLMTLIPVPLLIFATRYFAKAMRNSYQQERLQVTRLNTFVQERITGMSIVQLFNREKQEYRSFESINKDHKQALLDGVWAQSIFFSVVEVLVSLSVAFLLVWGAMQFLDGKQPKAQEMYNEIISFTFWINMLFRPIRLMADKFNILQRGVVRAERVFEVLDIEEDIQQGGTIENIDFNQDIHFKKVFFAYKDEDWVLKGIDLTIRKQSTVAFVGATGAGKTSIVNLLGRFYEYQQGEICIGETNIRDFELGYLRRNIAIVLQDVFLFSDTILNNITLNDPSISRQQVIEAAKAVGAHDFIERLPGGYDYAIGERGGVLSVGQRQLLAFIRAYVYNPHILILDEATSSVDNESEEMIQRATEKLTEGRTSIVIAHRLSTIQHADTIVVMDHGEIRETGSHSALLEAGGYYKKLYDIQFAEKNGNT